MKNTNRVIVRANKFGVFFNAGKQVLVQCSPVMDKVAVVKNGGNVKIMYIGGV